jgi:hypothetical protein
MELVRAHRRIQAQNDFELFAACFDLCYLRRRMIKWVGALNIASINGFDLSNFG